MSNLQEKFFSQTDSSNIYVTINYDISSNDLNNNKRLTLSAPSNLGTLDVEYQDGELLYTGKEIDSYIDSNNSWKTNNYFENNDTSNHKNYAFQDFPHKWQIWHKTSKNTDWHISWCLPLKTFERNNNNYLISEFNKDILEISNNILKLKKEYDNCIREILDISNELHTIKHNKTNQKKLIINFNQDATFSHVAFKVVRANNQEVFRQFYMSSRPIGGADTNTSLRFYHYNYSNQFILIVLKVLEKNKRYRVKLFSEYNGSTSHLLCFRTYSSNYFNFFIHNYNNNKYLTNNSFRAGKDIDPDPYPIITSDETRTLGFIDLVFDDNGYCSFQIPSLEDLYDAYTSWDNNILSSANNYLRFEKGAEDIFLQDTGTGTTDVGGNSTNIRMLTTDNLDYALKFKLLGYSKEQSSQSYQLYNIEDQINLVYDKEYINSKITQLEIEKNKLERKSIDISNNYVTNLNLYNSKIQYKTTIETLPSLRTAYYDSELELLKFNNLPTFNAILELLEISGNILLHTALNNYREKAKSKLQIRESDLNNYDSTTSNYNNDEIIIDDLNIYTNNILDNLKEIHSHDNKLIQVGNVSFKHDIFDDTTINNLIQDISNNNNEIINYYLLNILPNKESIINVSNELLHLQDALIQNNQEIQNKINIKNNLDVSYNDNKNIYENKISIIYEKFDSYQIILNTIASEKLKNISNSIKQELTQEITDNNAFNNLFTSLYKNQLSLLVNHNSFNSISSSYVNQVKTQLESYNSNVKENINTLINTFNEYNSGSINEYETYNIISPSPSLDKLNNLITDISNAHTEILNEINNIQELDISYNVASNNLLDAKNNKHLININPILSTYNRYDSNGLVRELLTRLPIQGEVFEIELANYQGNNPPVSSNKISYYENLTSGYEDRNANSQIILNKQYSNHVYGIYSLMFDYNIPNSWYNYFYRIEKSSTSTDRSQVARFVYGKFSSDTYNNLYLIDKKIKFIEMTDGSYVKLNTLWDNNTSWDSNTLTKVKDFVHGDITFNLDSNYNTFQIFFGNQVLGHTNNIHSSSSSFIGMFNGETKNSILLDENKNKFNLSITNTDSYNTTIASTWFKLYKIGEFKSPNLNSDNLIEKQNLFHEASLRLSQSKINLQTKLDNYENIFNNRYLTLFEYITNRISSSPTYNSKGDFENIINDLSTNIDIFNTNILNEYDNIKNALADSLICDISYEIADNNLSDAINYSEIIENTYTQTNDTAEFINRLPNQGEVFEIKLINYLGTHSSYNSSIIAQYNTTSYNIFHSDSKLKKLNRQYSSYYNTLHRYIYPLYIEFSGYPDSGEILYSTQTTSSYPYYATSVKFLYGRLPNVPSMNFYLLNSNYQPIQFTNNEYVKLNSVLYDSSNPNENTRIMDFATGNISFNLDTITGLSDNAAIQIFYGNEVLGYTSNSIYSSYNSYLGLFIAENKTSILNDETKRNFIYSPSYYSTSHTWFQLYKCGEFNTTNLDQTNLNDMQSLYNDASANFINKRNDLYITIETCDIDSEIQNLETFHIKLINNINIISNLDNNLHVVDSNINLSTFKQDIITSYNDIINYNTNILSNSLSQLNDASNAFYNAQNDLTIINFPNFNNNTYTNFSLSSETGTNWANDLIENHVYCIISYSSQNSKYVYQLKNSNNNLPISYTSSNYSSNNTINSITARFAYVRLPGDTNPNLYLLHSNNKFKKTNTNDYISITQPHGINYTYYQPLTYNRINDDYNNKGAYFQFYAGNFVIKQLYSYSFVSQDYYKDTITQYTYNPINPESSSGASWYYWNRLFDLGTATLNLEQELIISTRNNKDEKVYNYNYNKILLLDKINNYKNKINNSSYRIKKIINDITNTLNNYPIHYNLPYYNRNDREIVLQNSFNDASYQYFTELDNFKNNVTNSGSNSNSREWNKVNSITYNTIQDQTLIDAYNINNNVENIKIESNVLYYKQNFLKEKVFEFSYNDNYEFIYNNFNNNSNYNSNYKLKYNSNYDINYNINNNLDITLPRIYSQSPNNDEIDDFNFYNGHLVEGDVYYIFYSYMFEYLYYRVSSTEIWKNFDNIENNFYSSNCIFPQHYNGSTYFYESEDMVDNAKNNNPLMRFAYVKPDKYSKLGLYLLHPNRNDFFKFNNNKYIKINSLLPNSFETFNNGKLNYQIDTNDEKMHFYRFYYTNDDKLAFFNENTFYDNIKFKLIQIGEENFNKDSNNYYNNYFLTSNSDSKVNNYGNTDLVFDISGSNFNLEIIKKITNTKYKIRLYSNYSQTQIISFNQDSTNNDSTFFQSYYELNNKNLSGKELYLNIDENNNCYFEYPNTLYTFTNAGSTGTTGPTIDDINNAYSGTSLEGKITMTTQGVQEFIIPESGTYRIETYGAAGGNNPHVNGPPGYGAKMSGDFNLHSGEKLFVLVGQKGVDPPSADANNGGGGGGGGTFLSKESTTTTALTNYSHSELLIASGAGSGNNLSNSGAPHFYGKDAVIETYGTMGRDSVWWGGTYGSDGYTRSGEFSSGKGWNTIKIIQNGIESGSPNTGDGGFGGGGSNDNHKSAGGGGFSGGASSNSNYYAAGGGGSFNIGNNQVNIPGYNQDHGYVIIQKLQNNTENNYLTINTDYIEDLKNKNFVKLGNTPGELVKTNSPNSALKFKLISQSISSFTSSPHSSQIINFSKGVTYKNILFKTARVDGQDVTSTSFIMTSQSNSTGNTSLNFYPDTTYINNPSLLKDYNIYIKVLAVETPTIANTKRYRVLLISEHQTTIYNRDYIIGLRIISSPHYYFFYVEDANNILNIDSYPHVIAADNNIFYFYLIVYENDNNICYLQLPPTDELRKYNYQDPEDVGDYFLGFQTTGHDKLKNTGNQYTASNIISNGMSMGHNSIHTRVKPNINEAVGFKLEFEFKTNTDYLMENSVNKLPIIDKLYNSNFKIIRIDKEDVSDKNIFMTCSSTENKLSADYLSDSISILLDNRIGIKVITTEKSTELNKEKYRVMLTSKNSNIPEEEIILYLNLTNNGFAYIKKGDITNFTNLEYPRYNPYTENGNYSLGYLYLIINDNHECYLQYPSKEELDNVYQDMPSELRTIISNKYIAFDSEVQDKLKNVSRLKTSVEVNSNNKPFAIPCTLDNAIYFKLEYSDNKNVNNFLILNNSCIGLWATGGGTNDIISNPNKNTYDGNYTTNYENKTWVRLVKAGSFKHKKIIKKEKIVTNKKLETINLVKTGSKQHVVIKNYSNKPEYFFRLIKIDNKYPKFPVLFSSYRNDGGRQTGQYDYYFGSSTDYGFQIQVLKVIEHNKRYRVRLYPVYGDYYWQRSLMLKHSTTNLYHFETRDTDTTNGGYPFYSDSSYLVYLYMVFDDNGHFCFQFPSFSDLHRSGNHNGHFSYSANNYLTFEGVGVDGLLNQSDGWLGGAQQGTGRVTSTKNFKDAAIFTLSNSTYITAKETIYDHNKLLLNVPAFTDFYPLHPGKRYKNVKFKIKKVGQQDFTNNVNTEDYFMYSTTTGYSGPSWGGANIRLGTYVSYHNPGGTRERHGSDFDIKVVSKISNTRYKINLYSNHVDGEGLEETLLGFYYVASTATHNKFYQHNKSTFDSSSSISYNLYLNIDDEGYVYLEYPDENSNIWSNKYFTFSSSNISLILNKDSINEGANNGDLDAVDSPDDAIKFELEAYSLPRDCRLKYNKYYIYKNIELQIVSYKDKDLDISYSLYTNKPDNSNSNFCISNDSSGKFNWDIEFLEEIEKNKYKVMLLFADDEENILVTNWYIGTEINRSAKSNYREDNDYVYGLNIGYWILEIEDNSYAYLRFPKQLYANNSYSYNYFDTKYAGNYLLFNDRIENSLINNTIEDIILTSGSDLNDRINFSYTKEGSIKFKLNALDSEVQNKLDSIINNSYNYNILQNNVSLDLIEDYIYYDVVFKVAKIDNNLLSYPVAMEENLHYTNKFTFHLIRDNFYETDSLGNTSSSNIVGTGKFKIKVLKKYSSNKYKILLLSNIIDNYAYGTYWATSESYLSIITLNIEEYPSYKTGNSSEIAYWYLHIDDDGYAYLGYPDEKFSNNPDEKFSNNYTTGKYIDKYFSIEGSDKDAIYWGNDIETGNSSGDLDYVDSKNAMKFILESPQLNMVIKKTQEIEDIEETGKLKLLEEKKIESDNNYINRLQSTQNPVLPEGFTNKYVSSINDTWMNIGVLPIYDNSKNKLLISREGIRGTQSHKLSYISKLDLSNNYNISHKEIFNQGMIGSAVFDLSYNIDNLQTDTEKQVESSFIFKLKKIENTIFDLDGENKSIYNLEIYNTKIKNDLDSMFLWQTNFWNSQSPAKEHGFVFAPKSGNSTSDEITRGINVVSDIVKNERINRNVGLIDLINIRFNENEEPNIITCNIRFIINHNNKEKQVYLMMGYHNILGGYKTNSEESMFVGDSSLESGVTAVLWTEDINYAHDFKIYFPYKNNTSGTDTQTSNSGTGASSSDTQTSSSDTQTPSSGAGSGTGSSGTQTSSSGSDAGSGTGSSGGGSYSY